METIIAKDRKNMASREADIERARKVHQQRLKDVEAAERAAARGLNDRKDLSKARRIPCKRAGGSGSTLTAV